MPKLQDTKRKMNALQGQQAHRPGQSEATPRVDMPWSGNALQGQKRFSPVQLRFCPFRAFIAITSQTQGVALGYVLLGFQPELPVEAKQSTRQLKNQLLP